MGKDPMIREKFKPIFPSQEAVKKLPLSNKTGVFNYQSEPDSIYRETRVGKAMASLSAGHASRASKMNAIALKVTFPTRASSGVKV